MTANENRYTSRRSQGWHRGSDVDFQAVYRACGGERMSLTTAERREAVRLLIERERLSINEVAIRLDLSWRTVQRHRAALTNHEEQ